MGENSCVCPPGLGPNVAGRTFILKAAAAALHREEEEKTLPTGTVNRRTHTVTLKSSLRHSARAKTSVYIVVFSFLNKRYLLYFPSRIRRRTEKTKPIELTFALGESD